MAALNNVSDQEQHTLFIYMSIFFHRDTVPDLGVLSAHRTSHQTLWRHHSARNDWPASPGDPSQLHSKIGHMQVHIIIPSPTCMLC